jgi:Lar family restriction alleviation protein
MAGGKLKPCPFCGSSGVEVTNVGYAPFWSIVWCMTCGAHGPLKEDNVRAIAAWNRRSLSQEAVDVSE